VSHTSPAASAGGITILGATITQGWLIGGIAAVVIAGALLVRRYFRRGRGPGQR
jgi:hypothetical protein